MSLKQAIKEKARRLGFPLAGVTSPDPPPHFSTFERWLAAGRHGDMHYLADERSRTRRMNPHSILPECKSILVLAAPYPDPKSAEVFERPDPGPSGRVAAYAWGDDYHIVFPPKLQELVTFIEEQVGRQVPNRYYTDTGPLLERDLAQQAGLGWIGKNTCLINPKQGSYFLLAEILLGLELDPDPPFTTDHCGTCTRCINACPTACILPDRTLDARRCISYLTIELKNDIPGDLRQKLGDWVFGCDVCQMVCPWNRFASEGRDYALSPRPDVPRPNLIRELELTPEAFNRKFKNNPVKRAKRRGYLRNVAVAVGNSQDESTLPALEHAQYDSEELVRKHATWALGKTQRRLWHTTMEMKPNLLIATNNKGKLKEIQAILQDFDFELISPADLGLHLEVEEDGQTYAENAIKKALAFSSASGLTALADDSGLEVDALGGKPGLHSNRFGPQPSTDASRRAYLLQNLSGIVRPWTARFRATVAIVSPERGVRTVEGICPGEIIPEERGGGGFGYDPIFRLEGLETTMAELAMDEKNRLSHRGQALRKVIPILIELFRARDKY